MKILHTGDWHIGQSLNGYDRTSEFRDFFAQLEKIASEEKPDVIVVCGDIFDTGMPSTAAQRLYTECMLHLHGVYPEMQVVVTAGNHDSASRLEISRELWGYFGIHVVGRVGDEIIEIAAPDGTLKGYVAAVPFINKHSFPEVEAPKACPRSVSDASMTPQTSGDRETRPQRYFQHLLDKVAERNTAGLPVVLTAHAAVTGGDFSCHEGNGVVIGGEECFPLKVFGEGYDYLALGHIHKAQEIPGSGGRARYAGSVIPLNFDETQAHSVTVVEIDAHGGEPKCRVIPLPAAVPVLTVPEQSADLETALLTAQALDADIQAYVRLNVKAKDYLPGNAMARFLEALEGKQAKGCYIHLTHETEGRTTVQPKLQAAEIKRKSPVEMAKLYYQSEYGGELDPELEKLLKEVCDAI